MKIGDKVKLGDNIKAAYPRSVWGPWEDVLEVVEMLPDGFAVANASGARLAKIPTSYLRPIEPEDVEWAERGAPVPG